jgi:hypothetical protein
MKRGDANLSGDVHFVSGFSKTDCNPSARREDIGVKMAIIVEKIIVQIRSATDGFVIMNLFFLFLS